MWIKMLLQHNEIHENYVFSGFYRIPPTPLFLPLCVCACNERSYSGGCPPSYAIWILHGKFTEFFIYISIQFLLSTRRCECHQLHEYMANQMNILAKLRFSKCRLHETRSWIHMPMEQLQAQWTLTFMRRVHFRDTRF